VITSRPAGARGRGGNDHRGVAGGSAGRRRAGVGNVARSRLGNVSLVSIAFFPQLAIAIWILAASVLLFLRGARTRPA